MRSAWGVNLSKVTWDDDGHFGSPPALAGCGWFVGFGVADAELHRRLRVFLSTTKTCPTCSTPRLSPSRSMEIGHAVSCACMDAVHVDLGLIGGGW